MRIVLVGKYRIGLVGVAHPHVWGILRSLRESELGTLSTASLDMPASEADRERIHRERMALSIYTMITAKCLTWRMSM